MLLAVLLLPRPAPDLPPVPPFFVCDRYHQMARVDAAEVRRWAEADDDHPLKRAGALLLPAAERIESVWYYAGNVALQRAWDRGGDNAQRVGLAEGTLRDALRGARRLPPPLSAYFR